jgi:hypothetical protein
MAKSTADRSYIEENARELERLRALVDRVGEEELRRPVNERWTVADTLGHIAFWDGRALWLGQKLSRGETFTPSDDEPEDVDWINNAAWPLIHAIPPRDVGPLAVRIAEETDQLMASLPPDRVYPGDPRSPVSALRADHRGEHLDQIEAALRS